MGKLFCVSDSLPPTMSSGPNAKPLLKSAPSRFLPASYTTALNASICIASVRMPILPLTGMPAKLRWPPIISLVVNTLAKDRSPYCANWRNAVFLPSPR